MNKNKSNELLKSVLSFFLFVFFLIAPISVQSIERNPQNGEELVDAIQAVNESEDDTNEINLIATTYVLPQSPDFISKNVTTIKYIWYWRRDYK